MIKWSVWPSLPKRRETLSPASKSSPNRAAASYNYHILENMSGLVFTVPRSRPAGRQGQHPRCLRGFSGPEARGSLTRTLHSIYLAAHGTTSLWALASSCFTKERSTSSLPHRSQGFDRHSLKIYFVTYRQVEIALAQGRSPGTAARTNATKEARRKSNNPCIAIGGDNAPCRSSS